jgi:predicted O-methyltransferase YrrM
VLREKNSLPSRALWLLVRTARRRQLDQMRSVCPQVVRSLRSTVMYEFTPEENEWIEKLLDLRKKYQSSDQPLELTEQKGRGPGMTIGRQYRYSMPEFWALLMFKLVRELAPDSCLELGTSLGMSASYQAAALSLNGTGTIVTLEVEPSLVSMAQQTFTVLGLENARVVPGEIRQTIGNVLEQQRRIDLAFIDADHKGERAQAFFEQIAPFVTNGGVLVFDDIYYSLGMKKAWNRIRTDKRVAAYLDLIRVGICVMQPSCGN